MLEIKLTRQNEEGCSLSLPCALPELLRQGVPYLITYGEAEVIFQTGNDDLDILLKDRLPKIPLDMRQCVILAQTLDKLTERGKEDLVDRLERNPYIDTYDHTASAAANLVPGWYHPEEQYQRWLNQEIEGMRLSGGELFDKIMELARGSGDLERFREIEDYTLAEKYPDEKISDYLFNLCAVPNFGGSEGIYIDCFIQGSFGGEKKTMSLGTMKTLRTDLDACKVMGEVCGILLYHENQYVNENLHRFMPKREIEGILERPLHIQQAAEVEQHTQQFPNMTM